MLLNATPCCPGVVVSYRCTVQVPTILCEQEVNNVVAITNADNFNVLMSYFLSFLCCKLVILFLRFVVEALPTTEKVLAKDGLPCRQFQRKTEPEQNAFSDF